MAIRTEDTAKIVETHRKHEKDTGSAEVQIALQSARITYLTEHIKSHTKDHASRRGLLKLVGQRRRLLKYLQDTEMSRYHAVIAALGLRH